MFWYLAYVKYCTSAILFSSVKNGKTLWGIYGFHVLWHFSISQRFGHGRYFLWSHVQSKDMFTQVNYCRFPSSENCLFSQADLSHTYMAITSSHIPAINYFHQHLGHTIDYNIFQSLRNQKKIKEDISIKQQFCRQWESEPSHLWEQLTACPRLKKN